MNNFLFKLMAKSIIRGLSHAPIANKHKQIYIKH